MATPKDSLALRELYRIRNILAEPMAKALSLQDADACIEHVYAAFEKVEDKWHITLHNKPMCWHCMLGLPHIKKINRIVC